MTRKETERLVRRTVRETIPDREALWAKIEADLSDERHTVPEQPRIVRRHIYRIIAAAACFVLIFGGVGVLASMSKGHYDDSLKNFSVDQKREQNQTAVMDNVEKADDAMMGDGLGAADDMPEQEENADHDLNAIASSIERQDAEGMNPVTKNEVTASDEEMEEMSVSYEAVNFGESFTIEDVASLTALVEEALAATDSGLCLQEPGANPQTAGEEGLCVTLQIGERRVYLTMVGDRNRMTEVRGKNSATYYLPKSVETFLEELMTD